MLPCTGFGHFHPQQGTPILLWGFYTSLKCDSPSHRHVHFACVDCTHVVLGISPCLRYSSLCSTPHKASARWLSWRIWRRVFVLLVSDLPCLETMGHPLFHDEVSSVILVAPYFLHHHVGVTCCVHVPLHLYLLTRLLVVVGSRMPPFG